MKELFFLIPLVVVIFYCIYSSRYFRSEEFLKIKSSIDEFIKKCNELNHHIQELKNSPVNIKSYNYGNGFMEDISKYNFKRKEWSKDEKNHQIHNCSSTVCKNASNQPFKYLCKYFDIKVNERTLEQFEGVLNDFDAAEQGKKLLKSERERIVKMISDSIPGLIMTFSKNRLIRELGFEPIDFSSLYFPVYTFQYVSAGGNSSSKCDIVLNVENLNKFVKYLSELVKFKNSAAGQRALMTSKLREKIKNRDNHTCKKCGLSTRDEENLLLEIDHIIPISKGGITAENNLQTLCWKCNRSKGAKVG
nr:HNH endonuclease [uncultured Cetobacterium sp.]